MFGVWKKKRPIVTEHWLVKIPNFRGSTSEFYDEIEAELEAQEVPSMDKTRPMFSEGGLSTHRRQYLRLRRDRFVFDICSAPFGTAWFYSCRKAVIPFSWRFVELVIAFAIGAALFSFFPKYFGWLWGSIIFAGSVLGVLVILNSLATTPTKDLDTILLKIPVLGSLYEMFLRLNDTYYREDSRILYFRIVGEVVEAKVKEFAASQGITELEVIISDDPARPRSRLDQIKKVVDDFRNPPDPSKY